MNAQGSVVHLLAFSSLVYERAVMCFSFWQIRKSRVAVLYSVGELVCVYSGHPYKAGAIGLLLLICGFSFFGCLHILKLTGLR